MEPTAAQRLATFDANNYVAVEEMHKTLKHKPKKDHILVSGRHELSQRR